MLHNILELEFLFFPPFADGGLGTLALRSVPGYRVLYPPSAASHLAAGTLAPRMALFPGYLWFAPFDT